MLLHVKLKFLDIHDFSFLAEVCPKELRNAFAHQSFKINADGSILLSNGRKVTQKEVCEKIVVVNELTKRAFDIIGNEEGEAE